MHLDNLSGNGTAASRFTQMASRRLAQGSLVLDISKIEAGQFKLNLGEYALGNIVETVMVATESLASTKKLGFKTEVAVPARRLVEHLLLAAT
jgi:K+-sensing histidine kinase KdpD